MFSCRSSKRYATTFRVVDYGRNEIAFVRALSNDHTRLCNLQKKKNYIIRVYSTHVRQTRVHYDKNNGRPLRGNYYQILPLFNRL